MENENEQQAAANVEVKDATEWKYNEANLKLDKSLTQEELWRYRYLVQLSINAQMRRDMYTAEVTRAQNDLSRHARDLGEFKAYAEKRHGLGSFDQWRVTEDGTLLPFTPDNGD